MVATQNQTKTGTRRAFRKDSVLAWIRLMRVYHKIDRATAEHVRNYDLSTAQFDVLAQVGANEGLTQNELAAALLVTKGNVTQLLDRMEERGLIERRPARSGRGNHLYLRPEGRRLNRLTVPSQEQMIHEEFNALTPEEQTQLHELLRKLDRSLDRRKES
jgi:DNA-binding MarR family transcriptional regulator